MKAKMLKIAGVKTEAAFYKKFPTQKAFMKVHGKEFKKAQMGTLIGGGSPTQSVSKPMSYINYQELYDENDKLITGSTQAERDKAAAAQSTSSTGGGGMNGVMGGVGDMLKLFGDQDGEGMDVPIAYSGFTTPNWFNNTTVNNTTNPPNSYYNKFTTPGSTAYGQNLGIGAQTMGRLGEPQTPESKPPIDTTDPNWMRKKTNTPPYEGAPNLPSDTRQGEEVTKSGFTKAMDALGPLAGPLGSISSGIDSLRAERAAKQNAERDATVSDIARMASATREEESKRRYVRPEDIQNTGEEFFPIYGVGTNVLTRNGGEIHRSQNGSMIGGNPTEIQNTYSNGYDIYTDGGYEPLQDPYQVKDFRHGGYLHRAQTGKETGYQRWQNSMAGKGSGFSGSMATGSQGAADAASGGGTPYGAIGHTATGVAQGAMGGQNAGGQIGGTVGKSIGSIWGPVGGMVGEVVGGVAGQLLDTNQRDMKKAQDRSKANTQAMALNSGFQGLQESHNRYVRNGGDIPNYEDGGYMNPNYNPQLITMFGDHTAKDFADYAHKYRAGGHLKSYTPPSDRAMETYAMGGQLQTHWGGEAETMSYNPYLPGSGETVVFRGQSHTDSDGKGNTGIGITYGENPVEVERGEPMFEMQSGGEVNPETGEPENTGVVFGNMEINKKIASQFNDPDLMPIADKYHGKKFKNVGIDLSKQEAKQNKIIDKSSNELDGLQVNTSFDKLKFSALKANIEGANLKLKGIADTKIALANYQNAINDTKEEMSETLGKNISAEHLAKGLIKLDKDPVTMNAEWGSNIKKAKAGATTTEETTIVPKKERDAYIAQGYKPDPKNPNRLIRKKEAVTTTTPETTKIIPGVKGSGASATTGQARPGGAAGEPWKRKMIAELNRGVSYEELAKKGHGTVAGLKKMFPTEYRSLAGSVDIPERIERIPGTRVTTPGSTEEVIVENNSVPGNVPSNRFPWELPVNAILDYFRPTDQSELYGEQIYPEMYAMASNQVEPVPAQSYQPDLIVPYDISLQAQRNSVMSAIRNRERQLGYNPAAQSNMAPAEYNAINEIGEKEFMANQGLRNQVYTGNVNTMNEAKKINLGIFADQWAKQSQALSNTKATTQAALNSMSDKYAKNKLENRKLSIYENMYNYRFGKSGRAQNWNGLQFFDTNASGAKARQDEKIPPGYKATAYDANGNPTNLKPITEKDLKEDIDEIESVGTKKNGGSTKKNYKNSSVVRAYKNL